MHRPAACMPEAARGSWSIEAHRPLHALEGALMRQQPACRGIRIKQARAEHHGNDQRQLHNSTGHYSLRIMHTRPNRWTSYLWAQSGWPFVDGTQAHPKRALNPAAIGVTTTPVRVAIATASLTFVQAMWLQ
jgi:hypothetical protein